MKRNYLAPSVECLQVRPLQLLKEPSVQTEEDIIFDPINDNGEWS